MSLLMFFNCVTNHNADLGNYIYSIKNYKIQIFLLGFYQFNIGVINWVEIMFAESLQESLGFDNDFVYFNQENFWKIIAGVRSPHFNQEIEKLYYEKLPKYIARHPKTQCFAISQVIDDYGRNY